MVKLLPEDWYAVELRARGYTHTLIALELGCTREEAQDRIARVSRVLALRLTAEQGGGGADGAEDSG